MNQFSILHHHKVIYFLPLQTWACMQPPNPRTYKLTGTCNLSLLNGAKPMAQAIFDDVVLYPSAFVVVTPRGYTNHYYAGSERIASRIGDECWKVNPFDDYEKPAPEWEALELFQGLSNEEYPFGTEDELSSCKIENITPYVDYIKDVQYQCGPVELMDVDILYPTKLLQDVMGCEFACQGEDMVYYYHPDHLGSTSWVTDVIGNKQQFIAYMPYGEPLLDITFDKYDCRYGQDDARYKFTGKERDAETGYDYIEQRYYWWPGGFWLRPDPLLDKYIHLSPYAYCNGNPLKYVDPSGAILETIWDIANVAMDIASLKTNIGEGNIGGAVVDGVGLLLDAAAVVFPVVPGGAGTAIKTYRAADKVDKALDVTKGVQKGVSKASDIGKSSAPRPNNGYAKPHGGVKHNQAIDNEISNLPPNATNVRKNQTQVDVNGNKVGNNRPDVQYDLNGEHYNVEFDTKATNGYNHQKTIQANDPNSHVILKPIEP